VNSRELVDFHNHLIPGVDDGAVDETESSAAIEAFLANGVNRFVATPHVDGSLTLRGELLRDRLQELDEGWRRLTVVLQRFPAMSAYRGAEVMLDTPEPDLSDPRLRLNGGHYVLVEFPFMTVPPRSTRVIEYLRGTGVIPIIAHPERYGGMQPASPLPGEWRQAGAHLQVNAGSLTGRYGQRARANAFALLERGVVDYMCSDYHARGRPATTSARNLLAELRGAEQSELLFSVNPRRMLNGEPPLPVPPWRPQRTLWQRLRSRIKGK
jgi:protein-tyrosine phosphatase